MNAIDAVDRTKRVRPKERLMDSSKEEGKKSKASMFTKINEHLDFTSKRERAGGRWGWGDREDRVLSARARAVRLVTPK